MVAFETRPSGWRIAKNSWISMLAAFQSMPSFFLSAAAGFVLVSLLFFFIPHPAKPHFAFGGAVPFTGFWAFLASGILSALLHSLIAAPVAVAIHRFILLGETRGGAISFAPSYVRNFFGWVVVFAMASLIMSALSLVPVAPLSAVMSALHAVVQTLIFGLLLVISIRLAMVFPAVATQVPGDSWRARWTTSWQQMHGNFWLFVRAALIVYLPFIILGVSEIAFYPKMIRSAARGFDTHDPVVLGFILISALLNVPYTALLAGAASWLYVWVRSER